MPNNSGFTNSEIQRLTADVRRLRLKVDELVQRIRGERTTHYSAISKRVLPAGPPPSTSTRGTSALPSPPAAEKPD